MNFLLKLQELLCGYALDALHGSLVLDQVYLPLHLHGLLGHLAGLICHLMDDLSHLGHHVGGNVDVHFYHVQVKLINFELIYLSVSLLLFEICDFQILLIGEILALKAL